MKQQPQYYGKQPTEFSKKLLYVIFGMTFVFLAFALVMMWKTYDLTPLSYIIPALFVEVATATGFYYHKSKKENEIKLRAIYGDLAKDENDSDNY